MNGWWSFLLQDGGFPGSSFGPRSSSGDSWDVQRQKSGATLLVLAGSLLLIGMLFGWRASLASLGGIMLVAGVATLVSARR